MDAIWYPLHLEKGVLPVMRRLNDAHLRTLVCPLGRHARPTRQRNAGLAHHHLVGTRCAIALGPQCLEGVKKDAVVAARGQV